MKNQLLQLHGSLGDDGTKHLAPGFNSSSSGCPCFCEVSEASIFSDVDRLKEKKSGAPSCVSQDVHATPRLETVRRAQLAIKTVYFNSIYYYLYHQ
jgi:hypothetical protein